MDRSEPPIVDEELLTSLHDSATGALTKQTLDFWRQRIQQTTGAKTSSLQGEELSVSRADGSPLRILLYRPSRATPLGALLWMHGGGMVMGSPAMNHAQNHAVAEHAGCIVVSVDYRLAPEHPFPAALDDCDLAYQWLQTKAEQLGFTRSRIAVGGESSGGCLAAGLTLRYRESGRLSPSGLFLQYALLDDRTGSAQDPDPMPFAGRYVWTKEDNCFAVECFLGDSATDSEPFPYAAPARDKQLAGLPPVFLAVGDIDSYAAENLRIATTLIRCGVPVELHVYPGAFHNFISVAPGAAVSRRASADFLTALERHFSPAESISSDGAQ